MSITAADIPIPTTASLNAPPQRRVSADEVRQHRAREARHQTSACPHCGEWAIVEAVTAHRVGMPGVVQTISRCQRQPRWRGERCPVTILSEEWAEDGSAIDAGYPQDNEQGGRRPECRQAAQDATEAPPGPEEESMATRPCADCGTTIEATHGRLRCPPCRRESERARKRAYNEHYNATRRPRRNTGTSPSKTEVSRPVPAALRVSVLDLAQRAVEGASIRATVRAILALSPERQDLLRRLLDDVEAA